MTIVVTQFADGATYAKLHSIIFARNPVEVLLPANTVAEPFTKSLVSEYRDHVTFTSVPRRYFNADDGAARLQELSSTHLAQGTHNYLCAAAAAALIAYVEALSGALWLPGSARVRWETPEHFAEIPRSTARGLHILRSDAVCSTGQFGHSKKPKYQWCRTAAEDDGAEEDMETVALIDALPRTSTVMGQRLLRRSLLQPLRDPT